MSVILSQVNMFQKRRVCIAVLFLLIFFNTIHIGRANEDPISISLDCLESCKGQILNYSNNIVLELSIKNNLNYWVKIWGGPGGTELRMDIYNDKLQNGKDSDIPFGFFAQSILIKPSDELKVYIPFDKYNKNNKDNNIGDWRISPKFYFNEIQFYRSPSDSSYIYDAPRVSSPITGNDLQFKVEKPESTAKVNEEKSSEIIPKTLLESIIAFISSIISNSVVQVITTLVASLILGMKYFSKVKKRR